MALLKEIINDVMSKHVDRVSFFYFKCGQLLHKRYKDFVEMMNSVSSKLNRLCECNRKFNYVGLFMKESWLIPILIFGCMKSGKPFVFVDVEAGYDFNLHVLKNLHVAVIFTCAEDCEISTKYMKSYSLFEEFELWDERVQLWINGEILQEEFSGPVMLYAIQTSGTTGQPKIIQVPEQAILPNILHLRSEWKMTADDVVLVASPPTFDPFMVELLLAMTSGAALLNVSAAVKTSPLDFLETVFPAGSRPLVTIAQLTPSIFMRWTPHEIRTRILTSQSRLRVLALGGEKFPPPEFWLACREPNNCTQLYNLYGTTELSCWAMICSELDNTLGTAMSHTLLRVENDMGHQVLDGTGQLFIGSDTRICLMEDEQWHQLRPPVFRATGDIVTIKDGSYEFIGRKDNLVKRWGHRVSLHRVEAVAAECAEVTTACCVMYADSLGLFVSLRRDSLSIHEVKAKIKALLLSRLNKASLPDVILQKDHIPLTRHGKVNKNKLKQILLEVKNQEISFENPIKLFQSLWKKYTVEEAHEDTGFLSAGGNSVTAMQILNEMNLQGVNVPKTVLTEMLNNKNMSVCCLAMDCENRSEMELTIGTKKDNSNLELASKKIKLDFDDFIVQMKGSSNYLIKNLEENSHLKIAWSYNLGKCVDATPTCIVYYSGQGSVVAGSHSGRLAALDLENGAVLWETQFPDRVEASLTPSSCATLGLVGCYDGNVYCVSLATGAIIWRVKTQAMVKGSAVLLGNTWIFGSYDFSVSCLKISNGEIVWRQEMGGIVLSTPLPVEGIVVVASLRGEVAALDSVSGTVRWQKTLQSPVFSSPCEVAEMVLVAQVAGSLHALHPHTGTQIWQFQAEGEIFSSLAAHEDIVVFGCHDNRVYGLRCSRECALLLWRHEMGSAVYATPCWFSHHHLVAASTAGRLSLIDTSNGHDISTLNLPGQIFSSPIAAKQNIFVGCRDNHVYCIKVNKE